ncbi:MAG: class I SAM-dependent methyltransferase [Myxococcales bacterium]|nr:class I SAM-dependent methyltransferase [Myxococcales bacterium]
MRGLGEQYSRQYAWRRWDAILDRLGPIAGQVVLDLGCAIGDQSAALAARGARVIGVDRDPALLEVARGRAIPGARFVEGDLHGDLALAEGAADGLWLGFSAAYFPAIAEALERWQRWLRPTAWIAVTEVDDLLGHAPSEPDDRAAIEAFYAAARADGRYEFRLRERLRAALIAGGWRIERDEEVADDELAFEGPASPEVLEAWRARLARMPGLAAHLGASWPGFRARLLAALAAPSHRASARVWTMVARRSAAV